MSAKKVIVPPNQEKKLHKFPPKIQKRITNSFSVIKDNPLAGWKLQGELSVYRKFRLGDYRIVYRFDADAKLVYIIKIEHRQGVYK